MEVHISPEVVTFPPRGPWERCGALLYGANPELIGPRFTPSEANARLAGNRELSLGLIYPEQCVDGQVSEYGGRALRTMLAAFPAQRGGERAPRGTVLLTEAVGHLKMNYDHLLHACPPQHDTASWETEGRGQLFSCYTAAFELLWGRGCPPTADGTQPASMACALLGAGACGVPVSEAAAVFAAAVTQWVRPEESLGAPSPTLEPPAGPVVCMTVVDELTADVVIDAMDSALISSTG